MKQERIDTWKGIRSIGKWRFIFADCCIFYPPLQKTTGLPVDECQNTQI
jgi:hypothetical protein